MTFQEPTIFETPPSSFETRVDDFEPSVKSFPPSSTLIGSALSDHVSSIDHEICEPGEEDSFFVCDLGEVQRSYQYWKSKLPLVQPFYAVKCNTNIEVLKLLAQLGANFDCASKSEFDTILSLGISSDRIIYANPCKTNSFIRSSLKVGISLTTVDNEAELRKMKKYHPTCGILIRIATDDETAQCRLSTKFGCSLRTAIEDLLPLAKSLNLNIEGVAFHVGSGAKDFDSIRKAILDSKTIFKVGSDLGFNMKTLDIGGGFERSTFEESSAMVKISLDEFFPQEYVENYGINVIAEPGRFMVADSFTLATHVIARRDLADGTAMIYTNDGVYGNMNCILFDHQHPLAHVLTSKGKNYYGREKTDSQVKIKDSYTFSIWGPTCDGLDCISSNTTLSWDVDVGDWLYFPNLGAYTLAASTSFNGFKAEAEVIYVRSL